jgi:hypothetical protein
MDLDQVSAHTGLSADDLLNLARKVDTFTSSLTPAEQANLAKLTSSLKSAPDDKRAEIQNFLHSQVASGPATYGICILLMNPPSK